MADTQVNVACNGDRYCISGELTLETVVSVRRKLDEMFDVQKGRCVLDLSAVTRVDSSALSLWLWCLRSAKRGGFFVTLEGASENLHAIAELSALPLTTP